MGDNWPTRQQPSRRLLGQEGLKEDLVGRFVQEATEGFKQKVNEGICGLKRNHSSCRVEVYWRNVGNERSQGKRS